MWSRPSRWHIAVALVMIFLGLLISQQFRTQQEILNSLETQKEPDLVAIWRRLNENRITLELEVSELEEQKQMLEEEFSAGLVYLDNLNGDLEQLMIINGYGTLEGPGVTVTLSGDSPMLDMDLIDLINELWASGAEAIAVNGHRVIATTTIRRSGEFSTNQLTIDHERLYYPIIITALGDGHTLEQGLTFPGGLIDRLNTLYRIYPIVEKKDPLLVPQNKNVPKLDYTSRLANNPNIGEANQ